MADSVLSRLQCFLVTVETFNFLVLSSKPLQGFMDRKESPVRTKK